MCRRVLPAVFTGLMVMATACVAAPVEGELNLNLVEPEVPDKLPSTVMQEVEVLKHEQRVHHLQRPHEGHNDHHDPTLLQHLEHFHGHHDDDHDHHGEGHDHGHDHHHHDEGHDHHHHDEGHDHHHHSHGHDHHHHDHEHEHHHHSHGHDHHHHDEGHDHHHHDEGHDHDHHHHDEGHDNHHHDEGHDHDHHHHGEGHDHDHHHHGEGLGHDHHHHHDEHDHHHHGEGHGHDHHEGHGHDHHHHEHDRDAHDRQGLHDPPRGMAPVAKPIAVGPLLRPKIGLALIPGAAAPPAAPEDAWMHAACKLEPNADLEGGSVRGTVVISQKKDESTPVFFHIDITGFKASEGRLHGFHVHDSPVTDNKCITAGPHFNPFGETHGAPDNETRHIGDLGNIEVDSHGRLEDFILTDDRVAFKGPSSIIGKSIVVHAGEDDLGLGGDEGSLTTGNAGGRLACCNIYLQAEMTYRFKG